MIAVAEDCSRRHKHLSSQLEQRQQQVFEAHDANLAEVLAEIEELEANSSSRFNKIYTPDFGIFQFLLDLARIVTSKSFGQS
eukprot:1992904-Amphidinium_carterae.2